MSYVDVEAGLDAFEPFFWKRNCQSVNRNKVLRCRKSKKKSVDLLYCGLIRSRLLPLPLRPDSDRVSMCNSEFLGCDGPVCWKNPRKC